MSNKNSNNSNAKDGKKSADNQALTGVEVVKDDTVVYEDGDFEDYNAEHDYEVDKDNDSAKSDKKSKSDNKKNSDKDDNSDKDKSSKKDSQSDKEDKASKSDKKDKANKKDKSEQDDKNGITMAGIYQWASKLKDEFTSEAVDITHEVTEKAAAAVLSKLKDGVDLELAAFDKSVEAAKKLIENQDEERKKIESRKEKYQNMIDKLDQD